MKLLIVINSLILAGAEAMVKEMAPRLRDRGVHVDVAVLKPLPDSPFEVHLRDLGIPFIPLADGIYSPDQVFALARRLEEFDVVQTFLFPAQLWAPLAARLVRRHPILVTSEQNTMNRRREHRLRPLFRVVDRWMYSQYAYIPCASDAIAASLSAWVPGVRNKTSVVPNAIDFERFAKAAPKSRQEITGRPNSPIAVFTARLEPQKDHETVMRAAAEVPELQLVLLGDGPRRSVLQELACSLNIADRVHFLGRRPDVAEILRGADVYVHCSHSEGFGIAVVEAMAAGLPLIVSRVPGLAEVVGDAGVRVEPGDYAHIARTLRDILANPARRQELSQASLRRAADFGIEKTVDAYLRIYEAALACA